MISGPYGGFWRRLLAYLIDKAIVETAAVATAAMAASAVGDGPSSPVTIAEGIPGSPGPFLLAYTAAAIAGSLAYFTWFHGSTGQTPGKMALGLKVVQTSGERLSFGGAFLRWAGAIVSGIFLGLGYLWIAFDKRKQGWHDKIAATLVVPTRGKEATASPPGQTESVPLKTEVVQ